MNHQRMLKPMLIGVGVLAVLALASVPVGTVALFLIVLGCPLMMFLMMRGMDHGGGQPRDEHSRTSDGVDEER